MEPRRLPLAGPPAGGERQSAASSRPANDGDEQPALSARKLHDRKKLLPPRSTERPVTANEVVDVYQRRDRNSAVARSCVRLLQMENISSRARSRTRSANGPSPRWLRGWASVVKRVRQPRGRGGTGMISIGSPGWGVADERVILARGNSVSVHTVSRATREEARLHSGRVPLPPGAAAGSERRVRAYRRSRDATSPPDNAEKRSPVIR